MELCTSVCFLWANSTMKTHFHYAKILWMHSPRGNITVKTWGFPWLCFCISTGCQRPFIPPDLTYHKSYLGLKLFACGYALWYIYMYSQHCTKINYKVLVNPRTPNDETLNSCNNKCPLLAASFCIPQLACNRARSCWSTGSSSVSRLEMATLELIPASPFLEWLLPASCPSCGVICYLPCPLI